MSEPIFTSAHAAVTFALNFTMQQYDRPLMNKLAAGRIAGGEGKGLSGMDGAGQAGMVRERLSTLPVLHQAVLVSRCAPALLPCACGAPCCTGKMPNFEWQAAVRMVADHAERDALSGCSVHRGLTLDLLARLFGKDIAIGDAADKAGVSHNTATNHLSRLRLWLRGESKGRKGQPARIGVEQMAMAATENVLTTAGMVGIVPTPI